MIDFRGSAKKASWMQPLCRLAVAACCFVGLTTGTMAQTNTAYGTGVLSVNTGTWNSGFGYNALHSNTTGYQNAAFGGYALYTNTTGYQNAAFGDDALRYNLGGYDNAGFGNDALRMNTSGYRNSALGSFALFNNTTGTENAAVGSSAMYLNQIGQANVAVGSHALYSNTEGHFNTTVGWRSSYSNTTGDYNCAFGSVALTNNTTGNNNAAFGPYALYANTTGGLNVGVGAYALVNNTAGENNTAIGSEAAESITTGSSNTAIGRSSMLYTSTGAFNTALGAQTMNNNATGSFNVSIGSYSGPAFGSTNMSNTIALGSYAVLTTSNTARVGDGSMTSIGGSVNWSNLSDGRFKKDVREDVPGIAFIEKLRPVTYHYDMTAYNQFLGIGMAVENGNSAAVQEAETGRLAAIRAKEANVYTGFIAQEVEEAAKALSFNFSGVDRPANAQTPYALRYSEFVVPLVKAVQEQQEIINNQNVRIEQLEQRLEKLERLMSSQGKTGAEGAIDNTSVAVYPNPTNGMISITAHNNTGEPVHLQVYDEAGRVLRSATVKGENIEASFDLSDCPSGTYVLTMTRGTEKLSRVITLYR